MRKVSQANLKTKEAVLNGQSKFITCSLEMPVPYSFHDRVNLLSVGESQKIPCYGFAQIVFS